ncbi:SDR family NAD(P)-dependent oxidoreductase [Aeromicrobium sp.]|uniref:SDR family NAD(P)-dependent oxidoreductase n=1 Tax=Aeromicrobium sp. TaxID=1871063 RepID=UPI002FC81A73
MNESPERSNETGDPWPAPFAPDELAGRICLVTGAARGLGASFAETLGRHGATVVVTDIDLPGAKDCASTLVASGIEATALELDVSDTAAIDDVVASIERDIGTVGILINNAGLCVVRPSVEVSDAEWDLHQKVMLTGPFKLARRVAPGMQQLGRGSIVNICSISAFGGWPQRAAYSAAKAGLKSLTEVLAVEWAITGVRVNGLAPAVTRTEMTDDVVAGSSGSISLRDFEGRTPMARLGETAEMADAALFLASDRAALITGQIVPVDGGWLASDGFPTAGAL